MLEFHECAAIFPLLPEAELLELAADIEANGLIEPIVLCNGQILDGRNRYLACIQAKVEPHYEAWRGDDPLAYVVSKNLKRRHLNESQRAVIASKLANMVRGEHSQIRQLADEAMPIEQAKAAQMLNVSERSIQRVKAVERDAPELIPLIEAGDMSANLAAKIADRHYIRDALRGGGITLDQAKQAISLPHISRMDVHYSSERLDWSTPQGFFDKLNREFGFTLDVCATEKSAKCARYFSPDDDGLSQPWTGTCWMNPPYGNEIADWVAKAYHESRAGAIIVCLTPSRTDTTWWHDYLMHADELRFIRGRLRFDGAQTGAPFPSVVSVLRPESAGPPRVSSLECTND